MCNNCDRGHYLTHFPFLLTLLCLYMPSCHNPLQISKVRGPLKTSPLVAWYPEWKESFLMTRIWPHFICISPHQSRQRPSSPRSVLPLDSLSHRGDKAHTRSPRNCLISFRPRGFYLALTLYGEDQPNPLKKPVTRLICIKVFSFISRY